MKKQELPEKQLVEMKNILAKYFADTASNEMDRLWEESGWSNKTMEEWAGYVDLNVIPSRN